MSREIKFRGRSSEDKKTWFYGLLYIEYGRMPNPIRTPQSRAHEENTYWIVFPGFADWNMPREMQRVQVDPETIGEYTGLKDKSGKEIYEGDFIDASPMVGSALGEVRWDEATARFVFFNGGKWWLFDAMGYGQKGLVIGNIYENPEWARRE